MSLRVFAIGNVTREGKPSLAEFGSPVFRQSLCESRLQDASRCDRYNMHDRHIFTNAFTSGRAQWYQPNHTVLSQNIANVNTPGYKTRRVDFAELLQQLEDGDDSVSEPKTLSVQIKPGLAERVDGNNVELDREISELKKNALVAQAFTQLLASKLSIMRRAISS